MKTLRKSKKAAIILFLAKWFGGYFFKLFLFANKIKAYKCISQGSFIRAHYRRILKDPNFVWIDV
jgi:hypothetical protein